jgi:hypothetical protein
LVPALLQAGGEPVQAAGARPGAGDHLAGRGCAGELADGVAGQAQHLADLGVVLALGEQAMDGGVAFPSPDRQAALAAFWAGGRHVRFGMVVAASPAVLGGVRFRGGFAQVSTAGDDRFLDRVAQVLPQVEAVGHLDGARCAVPGALGIGARPVPGR